MKIAIVFLFAWISSTAHAALDIQAWTLENGARVLFVESRTIPILDVSVEFDAGSRRDPEGKAGTASLTNAMLARGIAASPGTGAADAMNEAQISNAFADVAAHRTGNVGNDRGGLTLRTLASPDQRNRAVRLTARLLAQPSFPQDLLERDKARTIAAIKEELTQPESIANRAFWRVLYAPHPYGSNAMPQTVQAINRSDLVEFHKKHYVSDRAVVAMIGSISRAEADAIARELTAMLPRGSTLPSLPPVPATVRQEERIAHPASQSHILMGAPALERGDPDYFPLTVGNYILGGGGFVSRLMNEVREKRGLSYSVYSYFLPMAQQGPFEIGMQTEKAQTAVALDVVRRAVSDFMNNGPTRDELQAAKDNLIGGFALRLDNNLKILENIAVIGFYNLPLDYLKTWTQKVAAVTAEDVKRAFRRKIGPERLATVVVGAE